MVNLTLLLKFVSAFAIALICFVGGIIPIRLTSYFSSPKTLSLANCLSAGILLGAALIHLLFDAEYKKFDYPFAHLCAGVGFFMAFILEKILFSHDHGGGEHGHDKTKKKKKKPKKPVAEDKDRLVFADTLGNPTELDLSTLPKSSSAEFTESSPPRTPHNNGKSEVPSEIPERTYEAVEGTTAVIALDDEKEEVEIVKEHGHGKGEHTSRWQKLISSPHSAAYILFAVLGLESIISGSALGIATTGLSVIVIMIAIITHIWAEAFALSAAFLKSNMEVKRIYKLLGAFSAITPVGVFIGMALQSVLTGETAILISSLLISFAAGTFLYIAIVEVIAEEFENGQDKWKKLNLLLLGFAFMSGLAAFI